MKKVVRRPNKIDVKDNEYLVKARTHHWGKKHDAYGMIHYDTNLIEVDKTQTREEMVDTILHELLHAVTKHYKVKFPSGRKEEQVVKKFATGLKNVLKDNQQLLDWIYVSLKDKN